MSQFGCRSIRLSLFWAKVPLKGPKTNKVILMQVFQKGHFFPNFYGSAREARVPERHCTYHQAILRT